MGDDKTCTLACVKGGSKFVLADYDHNVVYRLDNSSQAKAREVAGQKVKVTGQVTGKTIKVTSIEGASKGFEQIREWPDQSEILRREFT